MILPLPTNIVKGLNNKVNKETWAIVTLSQDGVALAERLAQRLEDKTCNIYTREKYAKKTIQVFESDITTFMGRMMGEYDIICCIMATGIVVRAIAPNLRHKSTDPGILVMDTKGEYVISLLSGHLGGANDAARLVAKRLNAQAVITTGTDVKGTMAVDVLAEKLNCVIDNFTDAKDITALILNNEPIGLINQENCELDAVMLPQNIVLLKTLSEFEKGDIEKYAGLILISLNTKKPILNTSWVQLIPQKLVLGIGCRRDTPGEKIIAAVQLTLASLNLSDKGIKALATIGLKENELGIDAACSYFKARKVIVPNEMVKMVQSRFEGSEFVYQTTGLYCVSEPCGYIASSFGKCLLEKQKMNGITLSVWLAEK